MRPPQEITRDEIRAYLIHLLNERGLAATTYRGHRAAIKFLYEVTLGLPCQVERILPPKIEKKLPDVPGRDEVMGLLLAIDCFRYRVVATAMYAAGLRISESCRLRVEDIDSARMMIHVRRGKGRKDRSVTLSRVLLELLRAYWRMAKPRDLLFPGHSKGGHVSPGTVRKAVREAVGRDQKHLGAQVGFTAVLHTWDSRMLLLPHLNCVVPGGGLSEDGTAWVPSRDRLIDRLHRKSWCVYCKPPFGGPEAVAGTPLSRAPRPRARDPNRRLPLPCSAAVGTASATECSTLRRRADTLLGRFPPQHAPDHPAATLHWRSSSTGTCARSSTSVRLRLRRARDARANAYTLLPSSVCIAVHRRLFWCRGR
jgi:hypothetical protein